MYRFGDLDLDVAARELRRGGALVPLEPQAFDLLVCLVERRHTVVTKVELIDGTWSPALLSDANVTTRVKEVRRAVGDDGVQQHTIRSIRGRGYRFVAPVEIIDHAAPTQVTAEGPVLLGRDEDVATIGRLLHLHPVVTLVGPGGVGKTALARAVLATTGRPASESDAVDAFVDLASAPGGDAVLATVARDLDVVLDLDRAAAAVARLARLDALAVLDNCEHVVDAVAALVERLVHARGRRLRVLATSRVRLGVTGEWVVPVGPLPLAAAVELFATRAAATHGLEIAPDARPHVARIVEAVDRLPLLVEMLAARAGSTTLDELHAIATGTPVRRLTHRAPAPRHQSVEALVRWSVELLDPEERELFTALSVFQGSITAAGAASVAAGLEGSHRDAPARERAAAEERAPGDERAAAALALGTLADRSLLIVEPSGGVTLHRMLAPVRAVAGSLLQRSGAAARVHRHHAEHVLAEARLIDRELRTPDEAQARTRLDAIAADLRAAHAWARANDAALADALSGALHLAAYWSLWFEPAAWSQALLDRTDRGATAGEPPGPGALLVVGAAAAQRGQLSVARRQTEAALALTEGRGPVAAAALEVLADVALYLGELDAARAYTAALARLAEELEDAHARTFAATDDALALAFAGHPDQALAGLHSFDRTGLAPSDDGWLHYAEGEALALLGERSARAAFEAARARSEPVGNRFLASVAELSLATTSMRLGDQAEAFAGFARCLRDIERHGNVVHGITTLRNLVEALAAAGEDEGAVVIAAAVAANGARPIYGDEAERLPVALASVAARAGAARYDAWWSQGAGLDLDRAFALAAAIVEARPTAAVVDPA